MKTDQHIKAEIIAPGNTCNDDAQVILPYWVQDHIHGETKFLIRVWLEWKSKGGFRPGTLHLRKGSASSLEWWKVEEMGYAYQKLDERNRKLIAAHFSMGKAEWKHFCRSLKISKRQFDAALIELQNNGRRRGLFQEEDRELALAAREQGPPHDATPALRAPSPTPTPSRLTKRS
jgi:hypothetical protein